MGNVFALTIIGILLLVIGVVIGWDNDDKDVYAFHCGIVIIGVSLIAVALFKVYLLINGITV